VTTPWNDDDIISQNHHEHKLFPEPAVHCALIRLPNIVCCSTGEFLSLKSLVELSDARDQKQKRVH
jgi:hypothetical protein